MVTGTVEATGPKEFGVVLYRVEQFEHTILLRKAVFHSLPRGQWLVA